MIQSIKVSKSGIDVLGTANTPNDLIFDSTYNTFKIIKQGLGTGTISSYPGTITIAHNLGYVPPVNGFVRRTNSSYCSYSSGSVPFVFNGGYSFHSISADGTNVFFEIYDNSAPGTYSVMYYAFEVPLI